MRLNEGPKAGDAEADGRFERWLESAAGRLEWLLWGKAQPKRGSAEPAHPLLCHLIDVMAVGRHLMTDILPTATVRRLGLGGGAADDGALATLSLLIALHDLGKATPAFQIKQASVARALNKRNFDFNQPDSARHHGAAGVPLVAETLRARFGLDEPMAHPAARAVCAHHGSFPSDEETEKVGPRERGQRPAWNQARQAIVEAIAKAAGMSDRTLIALPADDWAFYLLLAALTSVADWIGSMVEYFPYAAAPSSLEEYVGRADASAVRALRQVGIRHAPEPLAQSFRELFGKEPWPLHIACEEIAPALREPSLILIEAPMGEGKTEAALLLADALVVQAGQGGLFVGLPTQATANQMLGRVGAFITKFGEGRKNLQLAHGNAFNGAAISGIYDEDGDHDVNHHGHNEADVIAEQWFARAKRALLSTFAVGTVDQALLGVLPVRHSFVRLFGLAGKTVVLDEVHAYDTYTSTLIDRLIEWLHALGASVLLLSATLPSYRRQKLIDAFGKPRLEESAAAAYPRLSIVTAGAARTIGFAARAANRRVQLESLPDDHDAVARALADRIVDGGCAGWICNTVQRAQGAYEAIERLRKAGRLAADTAVLLVHARFLAVHRRLREEQIKNWLGPDGTRPQRAIVIGTQVLEQSLDLDFDVLATDLAPIDLVLQRAGRLHRHQRGSRAPLVAEPRLFVVTPDLAGGDSALRDVAIVYDPFIVRRTQHVLAGRPFLSIPDEIEPLVEAVYAEQPPAGFTDSERDRERHDKAAFNARMKVLPKLLLPPTDADDPFAELSKPQADDVVEAATRLGKPSVEAIVFWDEDGMVRCAAGGEPVDIESPPPAARLEEWLDSGMRIAAPSDLVRELRALPQKDRWKRNALLRDRRPLVLGPDGMSVGRCMVRLDPELGLVVTSNGADVNALSTDG